jgi:UrcA family protein
MTIKRIETSIRLSHGVVHGDTVYRAGVVADDYSLDAKGQTEQILAKSVRRRCCWRPVAALLCAYGGITGAVSAAEPETPPPQQVVRIGDLNLRDARGVAVAYGRLYWAAEHVCPFAESSDHWLRVSAEPCMIQAISRAVERIGSPLLSTYVQSQPLFRHRAGRESSP